MQAGWQNPRRRVLVGWSAIFWEIRKMIKIQTTDVSNEKPAKTMKDNRSWKDIVVENTHEAALNTLISQLNFNVVDTENNWLRIVDGA